MKYFLSNKVTLKLPHSFESRRDTRALPNTMHRYKVQYLEWSFAGVFTAQPDPGRVVVVVFVAWARRRNQKQREKFKKRQQRPQRKKKYKRALNELNEWRHFHSWFSHHGARDGQSDRHRPAAYSTNPAAAILVVQLQPPPTTTCVGVAPSTLFSHTHVRLSSMTPQPTVGRQHYTTTSGWCVVHFCF